MHKIIYETTINSQFFDYNISIYFLAPILDGAIFQFNNENKARYECPNVISHEPSPNVSPSSVPRIYRSKTPMGQRKIGVVPVMGVKKHSSVACLPKQRSFLTTRRQSSPLVSIYRKDSSCLPDVTLYNNTNASPSKTKRSNSTISAAGAGIRQGLINIGKFLQAAQYIITLTLVFSIAWFPLGAVVFADTITRNFNEGFHKVET